ncbi:hypothetical protein BQ6471_00364 [Vibrio gazogenes]|nr:hypothetical protein BQ6471_00364 [Vibrio gazogenes]
MQCLVNAFTIARFMTTFIQGIKVCSECFLQITFIVSGYYIRDDKTLIFHHLFNELWFITVLCFVTIVMVLPYIRYVLQKQHGQDEVFVSVCTDGTAESVASGPQCFVNTVLVDFCVHFTTDFLIESVYIAGQNRYLRLRLNAGGFLFVPASFCELFRFDAVVPMAVNLSA